MVWNTLKTPIIFSNTSSAGSFHTLKTKVWFQTINWRFLHLITQPSTLWFARAKHTKGYKRKRLQTLTAQYKTCPTFQGKPLSQSIRGTGGWQQTKTVCWSCFASWCWYVRKSSRAFLQPFQTYVCSGVSILEGVSHTNLQHSEHPNNTMTDIWF